MSAPTPYIKSQVFADIQSGNSLAPIPGSSFDVEFGLVQITIAQTLANLALIQRSDNALVNGIVTPDSLNAAVVAMIANWTPRGAWLTATTYAKKDFVTQSGSNYVCLVAHTSGTFATDLAAAKWQLVASTGAAGTNGSNGPGYLATSTSSLLVATGSKSFSTQGGLAYTAGARVRATSAGTPASYMEGVVTSYSGTTLVVLVDTIGTVNTLADWNINLAGNVGQQGIPGTIGGTGPAGQASGSVRQTVMAAPVVTATGLPNFWPATAAGLTLTMQGVSSGAPFCVSAANNNDPTTGTVVDRIGIAVTNLTWTGLTNGSTLYAYVTINSDGTLTPGFTTLPPIYQEGGVPATTTGQFTFNIGEKRGYMGNGTTAPQTFIVFVGDITTSGGNVTATAMYALNGRYDSGYTATLPTAGGVSKSHNLGLVPNTSQIFIQCTTIDQGYAVGDTTLNGFSSASTNFAMPNMILTAKTAALPAISQWMMTHKTSTGVVALTVASWQYRFILNRGW